LAFLRFSGFRFFYGDLISRATVKKEQNKNIAFLRTKKEQNVNKPRFGEQNVNKGRTPQFKT